MKVFTKTMKVWVTLSIFVLCSRLMGSESSMFNPITDVCWECVFPITVSGVNITPGKEDFVKHTDRFCFCSGTPPKAGIPLTFWEPARLVDVTRHAFKLQALGGISVGESLITNRGIVGPGIKDSSFYHVHLYSYPIFDILKIFTDFDCVEKEKDGMQVYLSELDPTWNNETLSMITNPEAVLFSTPPAQIACIADCMGANFGKPLDKLFWCGGCEGSLYPFTGEISHHIGGIQASSLLVHRLLAFLHRTLMMKGCKPGNYCEAKIMPIIQKSLYKTQLVYPIPQTSGDCHPLGKSDILWGSGKSFPIRGEDFVYLLWIKRQHCLDAVKKVGAGSIL